MLKKILIAGFFLAVAVTGSLFISNRLDAFDEDVATFEQEFIIEPDIAWGGKIAIEDLPPHIEDAFFRQPRVEFNHSELRESLDNYENIASVSFDILTGDVTFHENDGIEMFYPYLEIHPIWGGYYLPGSDGGLEYVVERGG